MNLAELEENVGKALVAHSQWKIRLRHAVSVDKLPKPARDIACDNQCGLGLWLQELTKDPVAAQDHHIQDVVTAHTRFHKEAGRIAMLVEQGNGAKAETELDGPSFAEATKTLEKALIELRRKARG